jgi:hypothetical protein
MMVFRGTRNQRGHGIGSIFAKIMRGALPIAKRIAIGAGKGAIKGGASALMNPSIPKPTTRKTKKSRPKKKVQRRKAPAVRINKRKAKRPVTRKKATRPVTSIFN